MLTMIWKAVLIALFAFVVALLAFSMTRSRVNPNDQQNNQPAYSRATQNANEDESWEALWQRTKRDPIAFFTAVLAISTTLLFIIAVGQLWFLISANRTGEKAADAANKSAEIAERALIAGQRAFISAYFESVANKSIETDKITAWSFTPVWQNAGDTPTREMQNHISIKVFDGLLPSDWDFPDMWPANTAIEDRVFTPLSAAPKGTVRGQSVGALSIEQMREIIAGKKSLYMWGWATYRDVFPNTALHVTRFAVRIIVGGDPTDATKTSFSFQFTRRYNCSDEECEHQGYPATWTPREEAPVAPNPTTVP